MDESERQACRMYLAMTVAFLAGVAAFGWIAAFGPTSFWCRGCSGCVSLVALMYLTALTEVRGWL